jgi:hypothetical protein
LAIRCKFMDANKQPERAARFALREKTTGRAGGSPPARGWGRGRRLRADRRWERGIAQRRRARRKGGEARPGTALDHGPDSQCGRFTTESTESTERGWERSDQRRLQPLLPWNHETAGLIRWQRT